MRRTLLALAVLVGCSLGANALATQDQTFVTAKSLDKAASRQAVDAVGLQAINDAAAAAIIGALATQLQDQDVQFQLGKVDSSRASLRESLRLGRTAPMGKALSQGEVDALPGRAAAPARRRRSRTPPSASAGRVGSRSSRSRR